MGCGDVRRLSTIGGINFTGQERAALNKLTMPLPCFFPSVSSVKTNLMLPWCTTRDLGQ